jgi:hypothetical protein
VLHADARTSSKRLKTFREQVTAVITSPPYLNVTRFEEDQWLRLWFLGGEPNPTYGEISGDDRYRNVDDYFNFLTDVWVGVQPLTKRSAMLICRIGTMHISFEELNTRLNESICQAWPRSKLIEIPTVTNLQNSQTARMQRDAVGCEKEYDFKFQLNG